MQDLNHVMLIGRLTRDAELKYTNGGMPITKLGLAVNRRKKSGDNWTEEANFFDIVVFGRMGEALNPYLVKGKQIAVDGELRQNRWEQNGQKRSKVEITANNLQLLGGGGAPGGSGQGPKPAPLQGGGGPQREGNSQPFENYGGGQNYPPLGDDGSGGEDIPF